MIQIQIINQKIVKKLLINLSLCLSSTILMIQKSQFKLQWIKKKSERNKVELSFTVIKIKKTLKIAIVKKQLISLSQFLSLTILMTLKSLFKKLWKKKRSRNDKKDQIYMVMVVNNLKKRKKKIKLRISLNRSKSFLIQTIQKNQLRLLWTKKNKRIDKKSQ